MSTMIKKLFYIAVLLGICGAGQVWAASTIGDWQFMRPIMIPAATSSAYVKLDIDPGVSTLARPDLADLRVLAGGTEEVPYQLTIENEASHNAYVPTIMRDLSVAEGETMFILELPENGMLHDHLVLTTPSKNFKRPVRVYASDTATQHDQVGWRFLSDTSRIYNFYDEALGIDVGKTEVTYPQNTSRYLRIVIGRGEGKEFTITGAQVFRMLAREAKENHLLEHPLITQNGKQQSTEMLIDLGGSGVATRKVTLSTDTKENFSRRVVITGSTDGVSWSTLGQGYIFALDTPLFVGSDLSVTYPERVMRYIRVIVFNEDNSPVPWKDTVTLTGVARTLVFNARPDLTYALYYGNPKASAPHYDIARFFEYLESALLPEVMLGAQQGNPIYAPPVVPPAPFSERNANVLNGILVLLVASVSFFLIGYLKKLKLGKPLP